MPTIAIRDGQVEFFENNDGVENQAENRWTITVKTGVTADYIILPPRRSSIVNRNLQHEPQEYPVS